MSNWLFYKDPWSAGLLKYSTSIQYKGNLSLLRKAIMYCTIYRELLNVLFYIQNYLDVVGSFNQEVLYFLIVEIYHEYYLQHIIFNTFPNYEKQSE